MRTVAPDLATALRTHMRSVPGALKPHVINGRELCVGNPITIVVDLRERVVLSRRNVVAFTNPAADGSLLYFDVGADYLMRPDEEGKAWIRGHHSYSSEEGTALLTAYALLQG